MRHQHLLAAVLGTALSFGTCAHAADIDFDLMGACAYPTRKSGDKQAKSVRCTYNANFTRQP